MGQYVTKTFSDKGFSVAVQVPKGQWFIYSVTGSSGFDGVLTLKKSPDGFVQSTGSVIATFRTDANNVTGASVKDGEGWYRFEVAYGPGLSSVTGTMAIIISDVEEVTTKRVFNAAVISKVGSGSGFIVGAASNIALATCPASKTAATLVVPLTGFVVGEKIVGFNLEGQIESAGGVATVDADLRVMTAAAADVTDGSVGAITQLSVTAETVMSKANTLKTFNDAHVVADGETFYVLITVTTAAATDIALQAVTAVMAA